LSREEPVENKVAGPKTKQKRRLTVGLKLLILNFLLPVPIIVGVAAFLYSSQYSKAVTTSEKDTLYIGRSLSTSVFAYLNAQFKIIQTSALALHDSALLPKSPVTEADYSKPPFADVVNKLIRIKASNDAFMTLYVGSDNFPGLILDTYDTLPPTFDARKRPWYLGAKAQARGDAYPYITEPHATAAGSASGTSILSVAETIYDDDHSSIGVFGADLNLDIMLAMLKAKSAELRVRVVLFSRTTGIIIYHPSYTLADQKTIKDIFTEIEIPDADGAIEKAMRQNKELSVEYVHPTLGHLHGYTFPIQGTPWNLFITVPDSTIVTAAVSSALLPVLIMLGLYLVIVIFSLFLTRMSILRPLKKLTTNLKDLAEGDGDLTVCIDVKTNNEIGDVARYFNSFVDKLKGIVVSVKQLTSDFIIQKQDLVANTEETASAATEITANVESIKTRIENLDHETSSVSAALEQIDATVRSLDESTGTQATAVKETMASITQMIAQLKSVAAVVDAKKQAAEALTETITKSGEAIARASEASKAIVKLAEGIVEMSTVISNISSQTNLLSMNAAIEAAHAGNFGKGFAVVADEIRKLAETSASSSTQITKLVKDILKKVEIAAAASVESESTFGVLRTELVSTIKALEEINSSTHELSLGGQQIIEATTDLNNVTAVVKTATVEMRETVRLVANSARQLADISSEVTRGMVEIATGVNKIATATNYLQDVSQKVATEIEDLKSETNKFQTEEKKNE
jgi:methyl-accepting chemotaxis protein